jgi:hypothetical protein
MTSTPETAKLPVLFYLKLVGKISAALALVAAAGLAVVIFLLIGGKGANYREIISTYSIAHENLQPALLVFGLVMIAVAAIATWLVTLYASFSFAGPLYRFSRNLKLVAEQGPVVPVPLRATDQLQRECDAFRDSVGELRRHYSELAELVQQFEAALTSGDAGERRHVLARLQEAERRARL